MEVGEIWSEWQKKTIRVHYVGVRMGSWATITDALGHASDHDRVEVSAGTYNEALVINKELELVSVEGETPDVVNRGTCLTIMAPSAYISGFDFTQNDKMKEVPALNVAEGSPVLVNCKFPSMLICRGLPHVQSCEITNSVLTSGIRIRGTAGGTFIKNTIHDHEFWCVDINCTGEIKFENNTMCCLETSYRASKKGRGVVLIGSSISKDTSVVFRQNKISDPPPKEKSEHMEPSQKSRTRAAVVLHSDAINVCFTDNDFTSCETGVIVKGSTPIFQDNLFSKQLYYGILIESGTPVIENNRFSECRTAGILASSEESEPAIQSNLFIGNAIGGHGIIVENGAIPLFHKNTLQRLQKVAIKVVQSSGTFTENEIHDNLGPAVLVMGYLSCPFFKGNQIHHGEMQGIVVVQNASGVFVGNTIYSMLIGIALVGCSNPLFEKNHVFDSRKEGMLIAEGSLGIVEDNKIEFCILGILVTRASCPTVKRNKITCCIDPALQISEGSTGSYSNNYIYENKSLGILVDSASDPLVTGNKIECNDGCGVYVSNALGCFVDNYFEANHISFRVSDNADPTVRKNLFSKCEAPQSVVIESEAKGFFEKNSTELCFNGVIVKGKGTDPMLVKCDFRMTDEVGITFMDNAMGTASGCRFRNLATGCKIVSGSTPNIVSSSFEGARHGFIVTGLDTFPTISENHITSAATAGITCSDHSSARISRNIIECCELAIHLSQTTKQGTITRNTLSNNTTGVLDTDLSAMSFIDNTITGSSEAAVSIKGGGCTYLENTICASSVGVVISGRSGPGVFRNNTIQDNIWGIKACCDHERQGLMQFIGNDVIDSSRANVAVEVQGHLIMRQNNIKNASLGVLCRTGGCGLFEDNTISNHSVANIRVVSEANPVFLNNSIEYSKLGVEVTEGGRGVFEACRLRENDIHFYVFKGGDPTVVDCDLTRSEGNGLVVRKGGLGTYKKNRLSHNKKSGLEIEQGSSPTVVGNEICDNEEHGVVFREESVGLLAENNISGNKKSGVLVSVGSRPQIERNTIQNNTYGLEVDEVGYCDCVGNTFTENKEIGVVVRANCDPIIENNKFIKEKVGMSLLAHSSGRMYNNTISGCLCGVEISEDAAPSLHENTFVSNTFGIRGLDQCKGSVTKNSFEENTVGAEIWENGAPTFEGNTFSSSGGEGIVIKGGLGTYSANHFTAIQCGIRVSQIEAEPEIQANTFHETYIGVCAEDEARPLVEKNTFQSNHHAGLLVRTQAAPNIQKNNFYNEVNGLRIEDEGAGFAENNVFENNLTGCLITSECTQPFVHNNKFVKNRVGLASSKGSCGTVTSNYFCQNAEAGILVTTDANVQASKNTFSHHALPAVAIDIRDHGRGLFQGNLVTQNEVGLQIQSGGDCLATNNLFSAQTHAAVVSLSGGKGTIKRTAFRGNALDVDVTDGGLTLFRENAFNAPHSITVRNEGLGVFVNNSITGRVVIHNHGNPKIMENHIQGAGILVEKGGRGEIMNNVFARLHDKTAAGLETRSGGDPYVSGNTFWQCSRGVLCMEEGRGVFVENKIAAGKVGFEVGPDGNPVVDPGNTLDYLDKGIIVTGTGARGQFTGSYVSGCTAGVIVEKGAQPVFKEMDVYDSRIGVHLFEAAGRFEQCSIFDNTLNGIVAEAGSETTLNGNKISSAFEIGAFDKVDGSNCVLEDNKIKHQFSPASSKRPGRVERGETRRKVPIDARRAIATMDGYQKELWEQADKIIKESKELFRKNRLNSGDLSPDAPASPRVEKLRDTSSNINLLLQAAEENEETEDTAPDQEQVIGTPVAVPTTPIEVTRARSSTPTEITTAVKLISPRRVTTDHATLKQKPSVLRSKQSAPSCARPARKKSRSASRKPTTSKHSLSPTQQKSTATAPKSFRSQGSKIVKKSVSGRRPLAKTKLSIATTPPRHSVSVKEEKEFVEQPPTPTKLFSPTGFCPVQHLSHAEGDVETAPEEPSVLREVSEIVFPSRPSSLESSMPSPVYFPGAQEVLEHASSRTSSSTDQTSTKEQSLKPPSPPLLPPPRVVSADTYFLYKEDSKVIPEIIDSISRHDKKPVLRRTGPRESLGVVKVGKESAKEVVKTESEDEESQGVREKGRSSTATVSGSSRESEPELEAEPEPVTPPAGPEPPPIADIAVAVASTPHCVDTARPERRVSIANEEPTATDVFISSQPSSPFDTPYEHLLKETPRVPCSPWSADIYSGRSFAPQPPIDVVPKQIAIPTVPPLQAVVDAQNHPFLRRDELAAPKPVRIKGRRRNVYKKTLLEVQGNIQPNDTGDWVWKINKEKGSNVKPRVSRVCAVAETSLCPQVATLEEVSLIAKLPPDMLPRISPSRDAVSRKWKSSEGTFTYSRHTSPRAAQTQIWALPSISPDYLALTAPHISPDTVREVCAMRIC